MVLEVIQRPALLERVRAEIAPYVVTKSSSEDPSIVIDIEGLCQQPLVQSIYAEVLRVRNGTVVARVPKVPDFKIDGWHFPKDRPIMVSSFDTARNALVWNQGTAEEPHPLGEFWPERFLVDPNDASSGPVLRSSSTSQKGQTKAASGAASGRLRYTLDGTEGAWMPYGGGSRMCPGRHFAKKEMITLMAIFITYFDIELLIPPGARVEHDQKYFMFGVMPPKGPIPARIRRRRVISK